MSLESKSDTQNLFQSFQSSYIDKDFSGSGVLNLSEQCIFSGQWQGDILSTGTFVLTQTARVKGRIKVKELIIESANLNDLSIEADFLKIQQGAKVKAQIKAKTISIADDCQVEADFTL